MNKPILLSDRVHALAEKRAREDGFESVEAYVDALVEQDQDDAMPDWMVEKLIEGMNSPNAGPFTEDKMAEIFERGLARARKR